MRNWRVLAGLLTVLLACCSASSKQKTGSDIRTREDIPYPIYIEDIREKDFSGSSIKIIRTLEETESFTRYYIKYDSDGLKITGMMNVPHGEGPFPAVILNHGQYDARRYYIGSGFKEAADIFARNGYVAVGSDFRNWGKSTKAFDFFMHLGALHDVLYLVEAVRDLAYVDHEKIGMWGVSLGGILTQKAGVINPAIKVIALYGSMSTDDADTFYAVYDWHTKEMKQVERILGSPEENPEAFKKMSAITYVRDMPEHVIIHQGELDKAALPQWAHRLADALAAEDKTVELYTYPDKGHALNGKAWDTSFDRTVRFFDAILK